MTKKLDFVERAKDARDVAMASTDIEKKELYLKFGTLEALISIAESLQKIHIIRIEETVMIQ